MTAELQQIAQELQQLTQTQQQTMHWQQVMDHAETFRQLLGENLDQLAFEERQAVVQCLISKVVITGEEVDIYYVLPFGELLRAAPVQRIALRGHQVNFTACVWQSELLFKQWKSYANLHAFDTTNE